MVMLYVFIFIVSASMVNNGIDAADCRTVKQGGHFASLVPFHGLKSDAKISTRVQFTNSSARYLFASNEDRGQMCTASWNKLWGACRCGYLTSNHKDSDRFVFRRVSQCLQYESGRVIAEDSTCLELNRIEIAAYAYDNSAKPFENQGRLLKEFQTKLLIDTWYTIKLTFEETKTSYELFDDRNQHIETQEILHRQCKDFKLGTMQDLYFGGQCSAPQPVTVCYDKI
jgi:hypothetical protein